MTRVEIEAKRGIVRDPAGRIIRSEEWKVARTEALVVKRADYFNRIKNIEVELAGYGKTFVPENVSKESWWARFWELIKELF